MLSFLISLTISSFILPIMILIARKFGITDRPDERKHHKQPKPLLGGLGIFISFVITVLTCVKETTQIRYLIIYSGLMMLIGTIDDIKDVRAIYKLGLETICAIMIALLGFRINLGHFIGWKGYWSLPVDITLSVIWIVGITNAINIIDGLDGMASGISLIAISAFSIIFMIFGYGLLNHVSLILMGSILGFLIYNFHPSKLFMGDGGSLLIGFLLSLLSIMYINVDGGSTSIFVPIIILAVPIFETWSSMVRRATGGYSLMKADTGHFHNKLTDKGYSPVTAASILYFWAILAGVLGIVIAVGNLTILALIIMVLMVAIAIKIYI